MAKKLFKDISANTQQVLINQLCAGVIFYVLSVGLDKNNFGALNWSLAILLTGFSMLSFGIDQVVVKKIASGSDARPILAIHIFHVFIFGTCFYLLLFLFYFFWPQLFQQNSFLLFIGVGKLAIFFSTPFKQLAIGKERFGSLLYMMICSNLLRALLLVVMYFWFQLTISSIIIIFIAGDLAEFLLCLIISSTILKYPFHLQWDRKRYIQLFKEALPLAGVNLFTATMARFDWILIGIFASNIILAEYSFAYKIFEIASLPLLIIAPVLMARFSRSLRNGNTVDDRIPLFSLLLKIEMIIASFTALLLIILWVPVINLLTNGKYGGVNKTTILILGCCLPFLYINNFLWTINFAIGKFKLIFYIFGFTFLVNIVADILLIPLFKAEGAALAFLLALITQAFLFFSKTDISNILTTRYKILFSPVYAACAGFVAVYFFTNIYLTLLISTSLFALLLLITRSFHKSDVVKLKGSLHL